MIVIFILIVGVSVLLADNVRMRTNYTHRRDKTDNVRQGRDKSKDVKGTGIWHREVPQDRSQLAPPPPPPMPQNIGSNSRS